MSQTLREFFSNEATTALLAALGQFSPTIDFTKDDFLHPLRDVDHTMQLIRPWIQGGYQMLMIGPESRRLLYRIKSPEKYYTEYAPDMKLEMWVVAIPIAFQIVLKRLVDCRGSGVRSDGPENTGESYDGT
ncbi:hypothetical protein ASPSYDRAFT_96040 [Aspergillus sydowii CBS 593.65]|uniref:Uncharacterized protein n=1 Tax=Aspergillus sydowii CBS 593.65 TaxID=1036612 RepID=A0A1L9SXP6_9EURO|nr:uncharacterized protein ASPSYDRAFT_96040 [Aspergillus sydowii CBS 593.65]OJJ51950.1 hypothetical protein ASPSYDRAFT_96040 [Aspergillus sydowii CBS 593.65]